MTVNYAMNLDIYIFGKRAYLHDFVALEKQDSVGGLHC